MLGSALTPAESLVVAAARQLIADRLRRVLTADPRRLRLVGAKLGVVAAAAIAISAVAGLAAAPALSLVASANDVSIPAGETLREGLAYLVGNVIYATVGFGLALLTRSMAGGMALALAFAFIIDSALSAIPSVATSRWAAQWSRS